MAKGNIRKKGGNPPINPHGAGWPTGHGGGKGPSGGGRGGNPPRH